MKDVIDRLAEKVALTDEGCLEFLGALSGAGYGVIGLGRRADGVGYTHRLTYEHRFGPIPDGFHIDHLCRNRRCCLPDHLEVVDQALNNLRARRANPKSHCKYGHAFTPENTIQTDRQRYCRTCVARRNADRHKINREAAA
jgi:hypothetical protein